MPSGSEGFELIENLKGEIYYVVFVTAFKDHAIRAFESRALHYILKPIDEADLRETVERLLMRKKQDAGDPESARRYGESLLKLEQEIVRRDKPRRITINHVKGVKIIDPSDVSHIEGQGNCALIHFTDGTSYLDTRTLKTYEGLLSNHFFRIHRSYIVNLGQISEILHGDDQLVVLKSGVRLSVSRDRKKALIEELQNLIW
jgi:two-component system LytT family response regulator